MHNPLKDADLCENVAKGAEDTAKYWKTKLIYRYGKGSYKKVGELLAVV